MVEIRLVEPQEYERVGELTVDAYRGLPVDHLFGGYDDDIRDVASRVDHADVLVAIDDDGEVLGAVTFVGDPDSRWREWAEPGEVQFRLLAVDAAARGRGVGEALVRECITRANGTPIIIHTTQWMEAARRMYERLGFQRRPDRDVTYEHWYEPGYVIDPAWVGQPFMAYSFLGT